MVPILYAGSAKMLSGVQQEDSAATLPERTEGYERHFGLAEAPFTLNSSPRFLFESASYQAALKEITYALPRREPIIVITGPIGTGKTTLCRIIAERRGPRTVVATISHPPGNIDDLLRQVLDGFGLLTDDTSQVVRASHYGLIRTLEQFLASLVPLKAQAVIVFDEAHHLRSDMLEQIRLLSNLDTENQILQIILVGQPELDDLLAGDDLRQLNQRISRRHRLEPLQSAEVSPYVDRRLSVAQGDRSHGHLPEFTASAMRTVAALSHGVPRVINTLCDRALESAWADRTHTIDTARIVRVARALHIEVPQTVRVRLKRRYVWAAAAAAVLLSAVLVWTIRDSAVEVSTPRTSDPPEAVSATAPTVQSSEPAAPAAAAPVAVATAPPAAQLPPRTAAESGRFLVVVSSFRTQDRSAKVAADIVALGLPAFVRSTSGWQQVVVGPYTSRPAAIAAQSQLAAAHFADTTIAEGTVPSRAQ
jgi:type II secretory pathway predicted ATPase ExeA